MHHATERYSVAEDRSTGTFTVVYNPSHENLSHHESRSEANAAIKRYKAADQRRASQE